MEIDDARGGPGLPLNIDDRTRGDNLALGDGHGFHNGVVSVDGQDLTVYQDQVRSLRRRNPLQGEKQPADCDA